MTARVRAQAWWAIFTIAAPLMMLAQGWVG
jgi:hypothetical protein